VPRRHEHEPRRERATSEDDSSRALASLEEHRGDPAASKVAPASPRSQRSSATRAASAAVIAGEMELANSTASMKFPPSFTAAFGDPSSRPRPNDRSAANGRKPARRTVPSPSRSACAAARSASTSAIPHSVTSKRDSES
jgi:hypothetical protein